MRFSGGTPALRSIIAVWTSTAQRTASTTLRNSMIAAVPGALDNAAVVHGNDRIDQVAAERPEPRQRPVFVRPCEPAIAGDVGHQKSPRASGSRSLSRAPALKIAQSGR